MADFADFHLKRLNAKVPPALAPVVARKAPMLNTFKKFDDIVFGRLLPHPTQQDFTDISRIANEIKQDPNIGFIVEQMDALDAKVSALLTHISLIVAAITFIYSSSYSSVLFRIIILVELSMYLFLSIFCIRSIRLVTRNYNGTNRLDSVLDEEYAFVEEYCKRFEAYNFASNATVLVTSIMILTLLGEGIMAMIP